MREIGLEQIQRDSATVATVGTFDGVHVGHRAILRYLMHRATDRDGRSAVITFDPHPREVVHDEEVPLLTTIEERASIFAELGVDRVIVVPFTREFSRLSPEQFVRQILVDRVGLQEIVVGYDHAFGRGRSGDRAVLERLGTKLGFQVDVIPAQVVERHVVSSTEIRHLLTEDGDVHLAAEMLDRPYSFSGTVIRGSARGRRSGFPTANLKALHPRKVVPLRGVYAVWALLDGTREKRGGMMNIGHRPTFDGVGEHLEVHLFDFDGDLYGSQLRVEFVQRLRDERRFESADALARQLSRDRSRCRKLLDGAA